MDDASVGPDGWVRLERFDVARAWPSLAALASDYWRYLRLPRRARDSDDGAAWTCVHDLVREPAWSGAADLIATLLDQARDEGELALVAAGPLEELIVSIEQGPAFIDEIEARARQDARWTAAVAALWLDRDAAPDVNRRLARFGARYADGATTDVPFGER